MNEHDMEQTNEISLLDLYKILKRNWVLITLMVVIIGGLVGAYSIVMVDDKFESKADIMVQVPYEGTTENNFDLLNAQRLLPTVAEFLSSERVLLEVVDALGLDMTVSEIRSNLSVRSSTTSYFIYISYESTDNQLSRDMVNTIIAEAIDLANNDADFLIFANKITQTSNANLGVFSSPNRPLYVIIGLILGGIIGVGIVFLKEMMNNTFRTKEQLEAAFGIQVLGVIPEFEVKEARK